MPSDVDRCARQAGSWRPWCGGGQRDDDLVPVATEPFVAVAPGAQQCGGVASQMVAQQRTVRGFIQIEPDGLITDSEHDGSRARSGLLPRGERLIPPAPRAFSVR